jgi:8-oxo-dGTP diphosphatase
VISLSQAVRPYSFCHCCGSPYQGAPVWPRQCQVCGTEVFLNTVPVAILLAPTADDGLAVIRRGIEPGKGGLALPGGYREGTGDGKTPWMTWQETAVDEFEDETKIKGVVTPDRVIHFDTRSAFGGTRDIITGRFDGVVDPTRFVPNPEATELVVIHDPTEMAFENNTEVVNLYFAWLAQQRAS